MAKETRSRSFSDCMSLLRNLDHNQLFEVLSQGFCQHCEALLEDRVKSFQTEKVCDFDNKDCEDASWYSEESDRTDDRKISSQDYVPTPKPINSLTNKDQQVSSLAELSNNNRNSSQQSGSEELINDVSRGNLPLVDCKLSEEQENIRASQMGWKNDFCCFERIDGRLTNVVDGLELYTRVFNAEEQKRIVQFVHHFQDKGKRGQLRGRTYAEPRKWMRGKGRITIQFGCCYNYARDKEGIPPGIIRDAEVEPLPLLFKDMIKRMVRWGVLPETCIPDSCIVNIYNDGDCIPPHIDHHDFVRPLCTVSLVSDCNILFGTSLKILDAGEFKGPIPVGLPVGSVLIFSGNGANIAKHCISAVSRKRISITFRKMDIKKRPYSFRPDPEMRSIKPLTGLPVQIKPHMSHKLPQRKDQSDRHNLNKQSRTSTKKRAIHDYHYLIERDEFHHGRRVRFRN